MKLASIDFEYNKSKEKFLNLVCASVRNKVITADFWLHGPESETRKIKTKGGTFLGMKMEPSESSYTILHDRRKELVNYLNDLNDKGYVFLAWNVVAEARSFLALGLDPLKFRWVDLYLEYRCLTN